MGKAICKCALRRLSEEGCALEPLTGAGYGSLAAFVHLVDLFSIGDQGTCSAAIAAMRALVPVMRRSGAAGLARAWLEAEQVPSLLVVFG